MTTKSTSTKGTSNPFYHAYWQQLRCLIQAKNPKSEFLSVQAPTTATFKRSVGGLSGVSINYSIPQGNRLRVELYIDTPDAKENKRIFDFLKRRKDKVEAKFRHALEWEHASSKRACRVYFEKSFVDEVKEINDLGSWPKYLEWHLTHMEALEKAFADALDDARRFFK